MRQRRRMRCHLVPLISNCAGASPVPPCDEVPAFLEVRALFAFDSSHSSATCHSLNCIYRGIMPKRHKNKPKGNQQKPSRKSLNDSFRSQSLGTQGSPGSLSHDIYRPLNLGLTRKKATISSRYEMSSTTLNGTITRGRLVSSYAIRLSPL